IGQHVGGDISSYWVRQLAWVLVGLLIMFLISLIDYETLGRYSILIWLGSVSLLLLVLVVGKEINGSKSWLQIPGATLQPAEFAKSCSLLFAAWLLSLRMDIKGISRFFIPSIAILVPLFLIGIQPDHGSAFILVPIFASLCFIGGIEKKWIIGAILVMLVCAYPVYKFGLKDYQRDRIEVFLGLKEDKMGSEWNAEQSLLAVGTGGFKGKGFGNGTMYILGYLPQTVAPTDFIFSVIGEETGFIGSCVLIFTYLLIILRAVYIVAKTNDNFGKFLGVGTIAFFTTHCYINIGMTIGVAPIVGVPLPFMSYGGSFMIGCMMFMGLLQSIYVHRKR
ncbi:MAG: FtsW/RodA/SpoVE family cell cycle protein, partial [Lentisphaeria bacterium]